MSLEAREDDYLTIAYPNIRDNIIDFAFGNFPDVSDCLGWRE
jgi:hypothetical protein